MGSIIPRQCILQSGVLPLSPPQPREVAEGLVRRVTEAVSALGGGDLRSASVSVLLQAQEDLGLVSYFLQEEDALSGWESRLGDFERVMIGDTEYEVPTTYPEGQLMAGLLTRVPCSLSSGETASKAVHR